MLRTTIRIFAAQAVITEYLEKHFRRTLSKINRMAMHKLHAVPRTTSSQPIRLKTTSRLAFQSEMVN